MLNQPSTDNISIHQSSQQNSCPSSPIPQPSSQMSGALTAFEASKIRLQHIFRQREAKKIAKECLKKWKNEKNLFIEKFPEFEEQSAVIFGLMAEVVQYMINQQNLQSNWRQNQIEKTGEFVTRTQNIFSVIRKNNLQIYDLNANKVVNESINSLKMIANELYTEKISGGKTLINSLINCRIQQISSIIIAKLALTFEQEESELSVFSEQSFCCKATEQRKTKRTKSLSLIKLLSSQPILRMKSQIQQVQTEAIRKSCLQSLAKTFPPSAVSQKKEFSQNFKSEQEKKQKQQKRLEQIATIQNQKVSEAEQSKQVQYTGKIKSEPVS